MSWWNLGYERVIPHEARATLISFQQAFPDYVDRQWDARRRDPEKPTYWDARTDVRPQGKWPAQLKTSKVVNLPTPLRSVAK